ncbi:hypothetical protein DYBT9275_02506 [Dyadobacter sp. CECT 9275]|uniref:Uncharacterized protein n=1 Tax=Dyadobacter helix TaxID=2822344 RepID=A0A916N4H8_9BACT|nr:hypothetical protein [Dyadobacter sp. CECT 9275]CAG5000654.1 hypothetical protein DYBT9275_02506 [Dyadobacter sp. CECT 9275]
METSKFRKIFRYCVYILLIAATTVIVKHFTTPEPIDTASNKDLTLFIEKAISEIDQKLKSNETRPDIATALSWHQSHAVLYNNARRNSDKVVKEQSEVLKKKILKVQAQDFPKLRKEYADSKKEILAGEHITINTSGSAEETLRFTGALFEPSGNKKKFMRDIDEIVKDLRFKRVVFQWPGKDTDSSDYEINSKDDDEI